MDVLFITAGDRTQASSRLRVYELLPFLEEAGISTSTISTPNIDTGFRGFLSKISFAIDILVKSLKVDVVYIQKVRLPIWFATILDFIADHLVYDFDDAIHLVPPGEEIDETDVQRHNFLISRSDLTIAGSRNLVEYARNFTDNVRCLHTGLPKQKYEQYQNRSDIEDNSILLGWIGNPENLHYLADIENELNNVLNENENIELRIITDKSSDVRPLEHREGDDVEYINWSLESALSNLSEVDVGLRPLRDDEWTRSKGGFTAVIECLALGIPVVASPVSLVSFIIRDGENGFLVSESVDWNEKLAEIAENPQIVNEIQNGTIQTVSKWKFWSENTADGLLEILNELQRDS